MSPIVNCAISFRPLWISPMVADQGDSQAKGEKEGLFPPTRWTVVRKLANGRQTVSFPAWDEFVTAYRKPLECWLLTRCRDPGLAEELVQSFLAKMSGNEHALNNLDPSKGRLRSWLLVCLKRHWLDHLPLVTEELPADFGERETDPDEDYDLGWAQSMARRVIEALREEYRSRKRGDLFEALLGVIDGARIEERASLHERFGMAPNAFDKALERLRERVGQRLRQEVAATVVEGRETEVDQELRHLILVLGRNGGFLQARDGD